MTEGGEEGQFTCNKFDNLKVILALVILAVGEAGWSPSFGRVNLANPGSFAIGPSSRRAGPEKLPETFPEAKENSASGSKSSSPLQFPSPTQTQTPNGPLMALPYFVDPSTNLWPVLSQGNQRPLPTYCSHSLKHARSARSLSASRLRPGPWLAGFLVHRSSSYTLATGQPLGPTPIT